MSETFKNPRVLCARIGKSSYPWIKYSTNGALLGPAMCLLGHTALNLPLSTVGLFSLAGAALCCAGRLFGETAAYRAYNIVGSVVFVGGPIALDALLTFPELRNDHNALFRIGSCIVFATGMGGYVYSVNSNVDPAETKPALVNLASALGKLFDPQKPYAPLFIHRRESHPQPKVP